MDLANLLIYHGTELTRADGPDAVRKLNEKATADAKKFINRIAPPPSPDPDPNNILADKEYRSA